MAGRQGWPDCLTSKMELYSDADQTRCSWRQLHSGSRPVRHRGRTAVSDEHGRYSYYFSEKAFAAPARRRTTSPGARIAAIALAHTVARPAFPATAARPAQGGASIARADLGRVCRRQARFAVPSDSMPRLNSRRGLAAIARAARLRPRLLHAGSRHRGCVPAHRLQRPRLRRRPAVERPRAGHRCPCGDAPAFVFPADRALAAPGGAGFPLLTPRPRSRRPVPIIPNDLPRGPP